MAAKPTMLTAEGLKNLEEELAELQNVKGMVVNDKLKVHGTAFFGLMTDSSFQSLQRCV